MTEEVQVGLVRIYVRHTNSHFQCEECHGEIFMYIPKVSEKLGDLFKCVNCSTTYYDVNGIEDSAVVCPECVAGKHRNCDGNSWDVVKDEPADCPCYMSAPEDH